jgi:anion-transporting  ArsA/GET3 family ATPase
MLRERLLFVTGKGGVGKSMVAAALASKLAKEGRRVLLALCNSKERLSSVFGCAPVDTEIVSLAPRLWAVSMRPQQALHEYGLLALKSRTLTTVLFDNRYVQSFFRAVPGMQEWTLLGKAWWHTTEQDDAGAFKYDTVIVDGPATGHGLDMLRVPKVICEIVPPGILRRDAERAWTMFQDPAQFGVVLVTLPEDLPTTETLELAHTIRTELSLPISHLFINANMRSLLREEQRTTLSELSTNESVAVRDVALLAEMRLLRETAQAACAQRLTTMRIPTTRLPLRLAGIRSVADIDALMPALASPTG